MIRYINHWGEKLQLFDILNNKIQDTTKIKVAYRDIRSNHLNLTLAELQSYLVQLDIDSLNEINFNHDQIMAIYCHDNHAQNSYLNSLVYGLRVAKLNQAKDKLKLIKQDLSRDIYSYKDNKIILY